MPPLPEAIIRILAPFAPLFSRRVWCHAQSLLLGAILTPGARTVTAALRVMGLAMEHRFTNYHRVLNRATWSALQASRILLGLLVARLVPPGAPIVLGADDTVERRSGRQITAKGCYRDAVRSTKKHVIRCFGLKWVVMMLLVPVPWARRVWALPFLTALCRPVEQAQAATAQDQRGLGPADDAASAPLAPRTAVGVGRRWRLCRRLAGAGLREEPGGHGLAPALGCRAVSPASASPAGQARPSTVEGQAPTPLASLGGTRRYALGNGGSGLVRRPTQKLWVFSHTALWHTRGLPPVDIRFVLVGDPEGKLRMEAFFCTDLQATPVQILEWVVMRWSVEVTFEEGRALLGLETQRQWSDQAIARTTPVLLGLFSLVTLLALQLSHDGQIPVPVTAWYHKAEPTFSDCLGLVRHHLWRARYLVHSTPEAECMQFPQEALDLLIHGLSLAA